MKIILTQAWETPPDSLAANPTEIDFAIGKLVDYVSPILFLFAIILVVKSVIRT